MSRDITIRLLGDPSSLSRATRTAQKDLSGFGKTTKAVGREVDQTKKHFEGLRHSALGLTGMLIGAGGLEVGFHSVIEAARKAQESQSHLSITMKDAGLSYEAARGEIERFIKSESDLSLFQKTDLRESFGSLVRATKDTTEALKLTALASNIARGRHISLEAATQIVIKAHMGLTGALRRMGIDIQPVKDNVNALTDSHKHFTAEIKAQAKALDQHATSLKAVDLLTRTYAGNAKKYGEDGANSNEKFRKSLNDIEVAIGTVLLPEVNKILTPLSSWMQHMVDSGKAAHFTHNAVKDVGTILHEVKTVVDDARDAFKGLSKAVGGDKHAIELLTAAAIAWKLNGALSAVAGLKSVKLAAKGAANTAATLRTILISLGATSVLTALGAAAAAVGGLAVATGAVNPVGTYPHNYQGKNGEAVVEQGGHWYIRAGRAIKEITPAQAAQVLGRPLPTTTSTSTSGSTRDQPGRSPGGAAGGSKGISWSGDYQGLDSGFASKLAACVADAGGTSIYVSSGRRSRQKNNDVHGASNSNHLTGHAADGTCTIRGRSGIPLGAAPMNYASFGLRAGSTFDWGGGPDIYHVDDGTNVGSTTTTTSTSTPSVADLLNQGTTTTHKPKTPPWKGATLATITTLKGSIAAELTGLPKTLDPVEKNAIAHIKTIEGKFRIHMPAAELAKDKNELKKWEKNLKDEIRKNAKAVADAAAEHKKMVARALQLDVSHILRDFDRTFARQLADFDKETQRGLTALAAPAQTPEEKALADFIAQRQAGQHAATIAQQQSDLAAAIATGDPQQIQQATDAINQQLLDDQQAQLETAAAASRTAADQKAADAQQAYQDQRDLQKQALQDINDDQRTALQNSLDDWVTNIENKKTAWSDFLAWLQKNGFDTNGLISTDTGNQTTVLPHGTGGLRVVPMAAGGRGRALGPTLFYSAGNEDFAFSGEGRSFPGGGRGLELHLHVGTMIGGRPEQVARELKPHLDRIIGQ